MLADGFNEGDELYYIGANETFEAGDGDRLEYGTRGTVSGPPEHPSVPCGVSMRFPGNKSTSSHFMCFLSRNPPSLDFIRGFKIGEHVYWTGASAGEMVHGQRMRVLGPGISHNDDIVGLSVEIGSKRKRVSMHLVSPRVPISLPSSLYALGEQLTYEGKGFELIVRDKTCKVVPGEVGTLVGHLHDGHTLAMQFPSIPLEYCVHVDVECLAPHTATKVSIRS
jgi:hypothetical protein